MQCWVHGYNKIWDEKNLTKRRIESYFEWINQFWITFDKTTLRCINEENATWSCIKSDRRRYRCDQVTLSTGGLSLSLSLSLSPLNCDPWRWHWWLAGWWGWKSWRTSNRNVDDLNSSKIIIHEIFVSDNLGLFSFSKASKGPHNHRGMRLPLTQHLWKFWGANERFKYAKTLW